jgi:(E)-4-hydroxy-3-methylbut-2-enyl-diphosphate synthase
VKEEYCKDLRRYQRRLSNEVEIGPTAMGAIHPIRIQSMTNTDTSKTHDTVSQIIRIANAGADYVRLTVPGEKDAENLKNIKAELENQNCKIPIIADIHFNPKVALIAAGIVNKVRINPGNYSTFRHTGPSGYSAERYKEELQKLKTEFIKLLKICRENKTAIRIGTNHGSLSDRIISRYGDTSDGMAESVMEFLRICRDEEFKEVVVSIKASNTRIMVYSNRMLVSKMEAENMHYPLHLGVTEAGDGEDGRIKSAAGIGALLADGIGDTIRISLTEDPELEIPVALKLVSYFKEREGHEPIPSFNNYPLNPYEFQKRPSYSAGIMGGNHVAVVVSAMKNDISIQSLEEVGWHYKENQGTWVFDDMAPDYLYVNYWPENIPVPNEKSVIIETNEATHFPLQKKLFPLFNFDSYKSFGAKVYKGVKLIKILASDLQKEEIGLIKKDKKAVLVIETKNNNGYADQRAAVIRLINNNCQSPVILKRNYTESNKEDFQLKSAADLGGLFIDGLGDGIWIENKNILSAKDETETSFGILQSSRVRISKTEYISCPSCGRTLFDLQTTTKKIQQHTSHLKGLKIGIMGCIVNGPGEMADADYGYVGSGKGRITLYKGKQVIKRNITENLAVEALISLIKENGDWVEP